MWGEEYDIEKDPINELTKIYIRINEVCKNDEKGNPLRSKVYNKNDKRRRSPRPDKDTYENYEKRYKYEYYKNRKSRSDMDPSHIQKGTGL